MNKNKYGDKMKKRIIYLSLIVFMTGCSYNATPEEKMQERETAYQEYYDKQMESIKKQEEEAQRGDYGSI